MSIDKLIDAIIERNNPTVLGLDPRLSYIPPYIIEAAHEKNPEPFAAAAAALLAFNRGLIDATCDIVPAVKLQSACYEQFRYEGVKAYHDTVAYAKSRGMYVIGDVKRGDIGSTCECYAAAHIGTVELFGQRLPVFDGDAMTVNPYLGSDGLTPFLVEGKMIFVLVKTSNPSSGELQDKEMEGRPLYRAVADLVMALGAGSVGKYGYSEVGAVVGATYPAQLAELRAAMPQTFFLVPGYGAQGGGAADVEAAFDKNGFGAIVNSSRGIMAAWQKEGAPEKDYAAAARREALRMRNDLRGNKI
ncbi:MAG TPA: orotidine-5'-phosphate decarboxylase [Candidatus Acidoferrum sp.]|nr:orotidine-5'-phosphate decarboxylase [Candidatus Acidoferrum sp.]